MGGFGWVIANGFCDPDADWPGPGGLGGEWVGMTNSSPDSSESLSDSEISRSFVDAWLFIASFAGNRVLKPQVYTEVRGEGYDDIPDNIKVEIRL